MAEYTPTTGEVRNGYQSYIISGKSSNEKLGEFDRWLRSVQAEAYDRGVGDTLTRGLYESVPENPYT